MSYSGLNSLVKTAGVIGVVLLLGSDLPIWAQGRVTAWCGMNGACR